MKKNLRYIVGGITGIALATNIFAEEKIINLAQAPQQQTEEIQKGAVVRNLMENMGRLEEEIDKLNDQLKKYEGENKKLKQAQEGLPILQKSLEEKIRQAELLGGTTTIMADEIEKQKQYITELEGQSKKYAGAVKEIEKIQIELSLTKEKLQQKISEASLIGKTTTEMAVKFGEQNEYINNLEQKINELKQKSNDYAGITKQLEQAQQNLSTREGELDKKIGEASTLTGKTTIMAIEIENKKNEINELKKSLEERIRQEGLIRQTTTYTALENKNRAEYITNLEEKIKRLKQTEKEYLSAKGEIEELKEYKKNLKQSQDELNSTKKSLEKKTEYIQACEKNKEKMKEEINKAKEDRREYVNNLEKRIEEEIKKREEVEKEILSTKKSLDEKTKYTSILEKDIEELIGVKPEKKEVKGKLVISPMSEEEIMLKKAEVEGKEIIYDATSSTQPTAGVKEATIEGKKIIYGSQPEKITKLKPKAKPEVSASTGLDKIALGGGITFGDGMYLPTVDVLYNKWGVSLMVGEKSEDMQPEIIRNEGTKFVASGKKEESINKNVLGAYVSYLKDIGKNFEIEIGIGANKYKTTTNTKIEEKIESKSGNLLSRNTDSYAKIENGYEPKFCIGVRKRIKKIDLEGKVYSGKGKPYYAIGASCRF